MIKVNRIKNDDIYNVFLTFIIGFTILIIIYTMVPTNHCSVYFSTPLNYRYSKKINNNISKI